MRPLQLTMTAFGPFAGQEQIDFTRLGENALFLINGPTGSGKTTILDAICFALYGKTTGDERDGSQMRCDLAKADQLSEVILEFEFAERSFRLRRVPEQQRPKARGEGTTTQSPEAQLYECLPTGEEKLLVSSKVSEATAYIEDLTGLSVDQFRQVMVLPQGKFRQLLLAESAEREKIFSQLFQTRIYKRLEEKLKEQSADIRRRLKELMDRRQGILDAADLASSDELQEQLQEVGPQIEQALQHKKIKEQTFDEAGKELQQGRRLQDDFDQLAKADNELQQLQQRKEEIDALRNRLHLAELAAKLQPFWTDVQRSEQELQRAVEASGQAEKQKQKTATRLSEADKQLLQVKEWQAELEQKKQQALQLAGFHDRAQQLTELLKKSSQAQQQLAEAELQLDCRRYYDQLHTVRRLADLQRHCQQQNQLLENKQQQGTQLRERCQQLEQQANQLELSWHQGQAAILADELKNGQACPVCGSKEHPNPAQSDAPLPSQQQVEQARQRLKQAEQKLEDSREDYRSARDRLRELQIELKQLAEDLPGELASLEADCAEQYRLLQQRAQESSLSLPGEQQSLECDLSSLQYDFESAKETLLSTNTQRAAAEQELPPEYRQPGALEQAEAALQQQLGHLQRRIDSTVDEHRKALGEAQKAESFAEAADQQQKNAAKGKETAFGAYRSALSDSAFADEQAFRAALLEEGAVQSYNDQITEYETATQQLIGRRQQLQETLRDQQQPDLVLLEKQVNSATEEKNSAVVAWQQLDKRLSQLETTATKLTKAAGQQAELDRQYAVVGTLSDVANGQIGNKVSLQRFVLSVLLDDVLIEASQRLSLMSKGRYQLLRKEDRAKGNKPSGLELEVEDAYTGKVRSVATLSGGESFMAALSLALGLSDVVQAYAGGIRLDTLFIDEGFGSLDPESLDLAVRTLVDLQSTGRMIGVISHVAELKEQLPLRIDVLADRFGSRTILVT